MRKNLHILAALWLCAVAVWRPAPVAAWREPDAQAPLAEDDYETFVPLVAHAAAAPSGVLQQVNMPYFANGVRFSETAVAWFGRVTLADNYVDMRLGYDDREVYVHLAVFDRRIWYNPTPTPNTFTAWDAATLYLDLGGNTGAAPTARAYRFDAQLSDWETRGVRFQAAYRGDGAGWTSAAAAFSTATGLRWESATVGGANRDVNNRGWLAEFHIPFASLGLAGPPPMGSVWGLGLAVHDRDDAAGTVIAPQTWPAGLQANRPASWGRLSFGAAAYTPLPTTPGGVITIRRGRNAAGVPDAMVGGGTVCGEGLDTWTQWGEKNYAGMTYLNVANQADVADWPCFSKYYVTFPLDAVPANKTILAATLTLYQFGNAGDANVPASYIQAFTALGDWNEAALTWNNAPLAGENLSGTWVGPMTGPIQWPGVARTWDVSRAVAAAYAAGMPLRLVLYSADSAQHSGRYFTTSEAEDWDADGRPTLSIQWGEPAY